MHLTLTKQSTSTPETKTAPKLSFIVSAYNIEQYLPRCLNSLVFQTCQAIEILVIDDGSTDKTLNIAAYYQKQFPHIVHVIAKENGGVSSTRACGLEHARAPFVSFVDGDDWVHPCMAELFLEKIHAGADFVYAPAATVYDNDATSHPHAIVKLPTKPNTNVTSEEIISAIMQQGNNSFWGKAWNTEFLKQRAQFLPILHEDVAEVPALISWVQSPAVIAKTLYYYYQGNVSAITKTAIHPKRRDLFTVDRLCWQHLNPRHADDFRIKLAKRLHWNLQYADVFDESITYAKWAYDYFDIQRIEEQLTPFQLAKLQEVLAYDVPCIPKRLILNSFAEQELYDVVALQQTAFRGEFEIIWIDEKYLEAHTPTPETMDNVPKPELAAYLACKEIAQHGGFYLAPSVSLMQALTPLTFHTACFVRTTPNAFSLDFFGGKAHSPVFEHINTAYERANCSTEHYSLGGIMAQVLACQNEAQVQRENQAQPNEIQIYEAQWLYSPYCKGYKPLTFTLKQNETSLASSATDIWAIWKHESIRNQKELDTLYARVQTLNKENQHLTKQLNVAIQQEEQFKAQRDNARKQRDKSRHQRDELRQQRNQLKQQRDELKQQHDELKRQLNKTLGRRIRKKLRNLKHA